MTTVTKCVSIYYEVEGIPSSLPTQYPRKRFFAIRDPQPAACPGLITKIASLALPHKLPRTFEPEISHASQ